MEPVTDFDRIDFLSLSEKEANALCQTLSIQLTHKELSHIQKNILGRAPTLAECLLWSIEGSEHCSYKSSKQHLKKLPIKAPNLLLGVGEDAAVVSIAKDHQGEEYGIAISHESHNHPSQIVPFEGAATGVGGNVRDISCMGATVIAVADSLRFGKKNNAHTSFLQSGVVSGIASYANALGVTNLAGDCYYHPKYQANCLVTVVSLGLVKKSGIIHSHTPKESAGYHLILVGKPTDNSGFGGASFASTDLSHEKANRGAVQEPNAFLERHLLKANEALFKKLAEQNLIKKVGFKDLGAGGIACAAVELAESQGLGANVNLNLVHTSMKKLAPSVILCAETQERFMWSVPSELSAMILEHYNQTFDLPNVSNGACASIIGEITRDAQFQVTFNDALIVDAPAKEVVSGLEIDRPYESPPLETFSAKELQSPPLQTTLETLLNSENLVSRKPLYEHYDKEVQGRTVIARGKAHAGVLAPFNSDEFPKEIQAVGAVLSVSQNPFICERCPELGAQIAVIQSLEKVASVGGSPQAITDCLCFGSPENPSHMSDFVKAIDGIKEAALAYELIEYPGHHLPVAAGNVSFYNQSEGCSIPASPMISALGKMETVDCAIDSSLKEEGNLLITFRGDYLSFAGSQYEKIIIGEKSSPLPRLNLPTVSSRVHLMHQAVSKGLIQSASPIHDGGLLIALIKAARKNSLGVMLTSDENLSRDAFCFMETLGFVVEVKPSHQQELLNLAKTYSLSEAVIGTVIDTPKLQLNGEKSISLATLIKE